MVVLRTPAHKGVLETEEVEEVADELACAGVAVAGVGLGVDEAVLEAEEVEEVEDARAG